MAKIETDSLQRAGTRYTYDPDIDGLVATLRDLLHKSRNADLNTPETKLLLGVLQQYEIYLHDVRNDGTLEADDNL
jgi:hypothetical protein